MAGKKQNGKGKPRKEANKAPKNGHTNGGPKEEPLPGISWSPTKAFLIVSSVALSVYVPTVPPSIVGGDTGELLSEACQLGIAHPPGYPLYTMLAYASIQLGKMADNDMHSPAYYANVLSCVLGALASGILAASVALYLEHATFHWAGLRQQPAPSVILREASAITVGLLHALAPLTWQYSTVAEVFALHNFFVALLLYVTVRFAYSKSNAMLLIGGLVCGLSMTNQHTSILLEIPIILWVIYEGQLLKYPKKLLQVGGCFLGGLLVYLYLPISAHLWPHRGAWGDLKSVAGFFDHLRRKDYGTFQLYSGDVKQQEDWQDRFLVWLVDFVAVETINPVAVVLWLYGCWSVITMFVKLGKGDKFGSKPKSPNAVNRAGLVVLLALSFYVVVFYNMSNLPISRPLYLGILKRFWLHPNVLCFWLMGVGVYKFSLGFVNNRDGRKSIVLAAMVASIALAYWSNSKTATKATENYVMHNYATAALESMPENSLLFTSGDVDFTSFRYLQECEGIRPDVLTASLSTMGSFWWGMNSQLYEPLVLPGTNLVPEDNMQRKYGGFTLSELLDANYDTFEGKVFLSFSPPKDKTDSRYAEDYEETNYGIRAKVKRKSTTQPITPEQYRIETRDVWKGVAKQMFADVKDEASYHLESFEIKTRLHFFMRMMNRATTLLDLASRPDAEGPTLMSLLEAVSFIELARTYDQTTRDDPVMMKNLGIAYLEMFRNTEEGYEEHLPEIEDVFDGAGLGEWWSGQLSVPNWKDWAKFRWHKSFGEFLVSPGAEKDPEYASVQKAYYDSMPTNVTAQDGEQST